MLQYCVDHKEKETCRYESDNQAVEREHSVCHCDPELHM
jgi:hypothetical protein